MRCRSGINERQDYERTGQQTTIRSVPLASKTEQHLSEMEKLFKPHCKLTLLMRNPESKDGDLLLTRDDLDEVIAAIERLKGEGS